MAIATLEHCNNIIVTKIRDMDIIEDGTKICFANRTYKITDVGSIYKVDCIDKPKCSSIFKRILYFFKSLFGKTVEQKNCKLLEKYIGTPEVKRILFQSADSCNAKVFHVGPVVFMRIADDIDNLEPLFRGR